jgi:2'-5' RNA ligase
MPDANPSVTFSAAWERFQGLLALRQIEDTLEGGASAGRSVFLAFLAPADSDELTRYVAPIAERLGAIPGVEPYPPSYWHVTVKGFGFETESPGRLDEFTREEVAAVATAAAAPLSGIGRITAAVGPANGFDSVVFLEVHDAGAFADANARLLDGVPQLPRSPYDAPNFLPHISIARFRSSEGLAELKSCVAELREIGEGPSLRFERIDLIRAHLSGAVLAFETIRSYALAE